MGDRYSATGFRKQALRSLAAVPWNVCQYCKTEHAIEKRGRIYFDDGKPHKFSQKAKLVNEESERTEEAQSLEPPEPQLEPEPLREEFTQPDVVAQQAAALRSAWNRDKQMAAEAEVAFDWAAVSESLFEGEIAYAHPVFSYILINAQDEQFFAQQSELDVSGTEGHYCFFQIGQRVTFVRRAGRVESKRPVAGRVRLLNTPFPPSDDKETSTIVRRNGKNQFFAQRQCGIESCHVALHASNVITEGDLGVGVKIFHNVAVNELDEQKRFCATEIEIFLPAESAEVA